MKIIKRDGRVKEYDINRITQAVFRAFEDVHKGNQLNNTHSRNIAFLVNKQLDKSKDYTVEQIQDIVINTLYNENLKEVADSYKEYRNKRNEERIKNSKKEKFYTEILQCTNVDNDNANINQFSFSGKKYRIADNEQKQYSLRNLISKEGREAFEEGLIYYHDLNSYAIGEHNCFKSDTKFITSTGTKSFDDFKDGDIIKVLTHDGTFKKAVVKSYGKQYLNKITFKRGRSKKEVYATKNHRWMLKDGSITTCLKLEDQLIKTPKIFNFDYNIASQEEKLMWCKGFAVGDGTVPKNKHYTRIRLCGNKNKYVDRFSINGCSIRNEKIKNDNLVIVYNYEKELPNVNEISHNELLAFIDGLYCADGHNYINEKGYKQLAIQFSNKETIDFVKKYFEIVGLYISNEKILTGSKTNYTDFRKETVYYGFISSTGCENWVVKQIDENVLFEDVWCLEVEDNKTFVLSGGIVTGNCSFPRLKELLSEGFTTRNGDVRPANSFSTACQLVAVIFQVQSQVQFGGIASVGFDWELEPFVHKSFVKLFIEGLYEKYNIVDYEKQTNINKYGDIHIDNKWIKENYKEAYDYAIRHLEKEGNQACQGLYHNLNTLESRAGSQVPFTSLNLGRNTSTYGRLITKWIFNASLSGIGKFNRTSIFPISIFQYKKGVNDKEGTPNYDLKMKAIESMTHRIYPNWGNGDWNGIVEDPDDYTTFFATMGCRTLIGKDIHTGSYSKLGRGNITPMTIILPKLGLDYGIALGKRETPDIEGFMNKFDKTLELVRSELKRRYEYICSQSPKSAQFMYENKTMLDSEKCKNDVRECIKHGSNAIGILGMAECCVALFGKHHGESLDAYKFALNLVKHIDEYCARISKEDNMNYSTYFSPAENLCKTACQTLKLYYGEIKGVTDRPYLTNSIHIPVYFKCDAYSKMLLEAPFTQYGKGGCITYVELSSNAVHNPKGIEKLIDYGMALNIPYLAFNFPIDTCNDCGYSSQINTDCCPVCGSENIQRLKRVTGYITTDYRNFNDGKIAEVEDRVIHEQFNPISIPILEFAKEELKSYGIEVPQVD